MLIQELRLEGISILYKNLTPFTILNKSHTQQFLSNYLDYEPDTFTLSQHCLYLYKALKMKAIVRLLQVITTRNTFSVVVLELKFSRMTSFQGCTNITISKQLVTAHRPDFYSVLRRSRPCQRAQKQLDRSIWTRFRASQS